MDASPSTPPPSQPTSPTRPSHARRVSRVSFADPPTPPRSAKPSLTSLESAGVVLGAPPYVNSLTRRFVPYTCRRGHGHVGDMRMETDRGIRVPLWSGEDETLRKIATGGGCESDEIVQEHVLGHARPGVEMPFVRPPRAPVVAKTGLWDKLRRKDAVDPLVAIYRAEDRRPWIRHATSLLEDRIRLLDGLMASRKDTESWEYFQLQLECYWRRVELKDYHAEEYRQHLKGLEPQRWAEAKSADTPKALQSQTTRTRQAMHERSRTLQTPQAREQLKALELLYIHQLMDEFKWNKDDDAYARFMWAKGVLLDAAFWLEGDETLETRMRGVEAFQFF